MLGLTALFGKLFGTDKAAAALVDNVSSGLDKMFYTDEEKAEDGAKDRSEARSMLIKWMESTQGSNLARRCIALTVTVIWALQYTVSLIMFAVAPWVQGSPEGIDTLSYTEMIKMSATSISSNGEAVTGAMILILGYYFAAPYMGKMVEGAMKKFGNKNKEVK